MWNPLPVFPKQMLNVLFICGKNKLRSPTAEQLFATYPGVECASAGLSHEADNPVTGELVEWADLIFVMEKAQRSRLTEKFRAHINGQRIICLDIPDAYTFMAPALIDLLMSKVTHYLPAEA